MLVKTNQQYMTRAYHQDGVLMSLAEAKGKYSVLTLGGYVYKLVHPALPMETMGVVVYVGENMNRTEFKFIPLISPDDHCLYVQEPQPEMSLLSNKPI